MLSDSNAECVAKCVAECVVEQGSKCGVTLTLNASCRCARQ